MPCRCAGFRVDKCECKVFGTGYSCGRASGSRYYLVANNNTMCDLPVTTIPKKSNGLIKTIETMYDKCAGYNLRYCPMRGAVSSSNYVSNALKDLVILLCFLVANFVVLLTILTKVSVDLYYITHETLCWLKKRLLTKSVTEDSTVLGPAHSQAPHDFSPKTNKKLLL